MRWLTKLFGTDNHTPETSQHDLHRAAAALLLEVARTDGEVDKEESRHLIDTVQNRWHLDPAEMQDILGELESRVHRATDLFEFTAPLREHWDPETRVKLIEDMWTMAAADGHADHHEEHLIRRVSDLLYVSHGDYIRAKMKAVNSEQ
ncbi:TerB family tellurite resistance protein [Alcanivorax sp. S6407]|uniref:tellurite resistance TerB family protein n=1 Tax=Alcanivorax sp. S6407 TaxID=2926424 RepID=UPI001FF320A2|nr:TerB family tellurite resistance protein [Alcanivorax sp. S6407]MCK0152252.1 TerB family tellurite resistance protein [Alcanivorax sp. S6407]